jgi:predicted ATP-grasp superfamily ATP-dependent carboligase
MDVPPTRILDFDGTIGTDDVTFPAMVKPLRSEIYTNGRLQRFEASRVENRKEMKRSLQALPDGVGLVQPYIEGRLISINGVSHGGELYAANQHVVHRVWPDRCGQCVFAETIPMDPARERATAKFMRELNWSGIFNLQLIERDGRDYVIDLNPRFYVSLTLAVKAGINMPAIWVALLLGMSPEIGDFQPGIRFRQEKGDPRAIVAQLRRRDYAYARDMLPRRHTVHALFSIRDPRPGLSIVTDAASKLRRYGTGTGAP